MKLRLALLACIVEMGCGPSAQPIAPPSLDAEMFRSTVQPILAERCANPSCHGNARRPLRVYAQERFRIDPARLHLDEPLFEEELEANRHSAEAFALDAINSAGRALLERAADSLLLQKPLGRPPHPAIFVSIDDRDAQSLVRWLQSGGLR